MADSATTDAKKSTKSSHPPYAEMIKAAITDLQNRKGSSRQAILKYINEHYEIHENFADQTNAHLRQALKHGIENGTLKQSKGVGAAGSFKLADPKKKTTDGSKQKDTASEKHATTSSPKKAAPAAASPKKTKKVEAVPAAASKKKVEAVPAAGSPKKTKKVEAVPAAGKTATPKKTAKKTANAKGGKKAQTIKKGRVAKK